MRQSNLNPQQICASKSYSKCQNVVNILALVSVSVLAYGVWMTYSEIERLKLRSLETAETITSLANDGGWSGRHWMKLVASFESLVEPSSELHSSFERIKREVSKREAAQYDTFSSSSTFMESEAERDCWTLINNRCSSRLSSDFLRTAPGPPGPAGHPGTKGEPGSPGRSGVLEAIGSPGQKGDIGSSGITGPPGPSGPPGPPGPVGPTGKRGRRGLPGFHGDRGDTGLPGHNGQKGEIGFPLDGNYVMNCSCVGEKGQRGQRGLIGFSGYKGDMGDAGTPGTKGEKGYGMHGFAGPKGETGSKGEKGDTGTCSAPVCGQPYRGVNTGTYVENSHRNQGRSTPGSSKEKYTDPKESQVRSTGNNIATSCIIYVFTCLQLIYLHVYTCTFS